MYLLNVVVMDFSVMLIAIGGYGLFLLALSFSTVVLVCELPLA